MKCAFDELTGDWTPEREKAYSLEVDEQELQSKEKKVENRPEAGLEQCSICGMVITERK